MHTSITDILARITQLEEELETEFQRRRHALQADFEDRQVRFEHAVLEQQRRFRMGLVRYVVGAQWRSVLSIPFIYSLVVPMVLLDVALTVYQWGGLSPVPHPEGAAQRMLDV